MVAVVLVAGVTIWWSLTRSGVDGDAPRGAGDATRGGAAAAAGPPPAPPAPGPGAPEGGDARPPINRDVDLTPAPTYPVPTRPPGGCPGRSERVVVLAIRDGGTDPACVRVAATQEVQVRNELGEELVFVVGEVQETIPEGDELRLGVAGEILERGVNYFWMVGHPDKSGIIELG